MPRRRYSLFIEPTDRRPGWRLGSRVVPRRFTIYVQKYYRAFDPRVHPDRIRSLDLSDDEVDAIHAGAPTAGDDSAIGLRTWLELEVESSPTIPPRCVVLRAPNGISTPEQRFPLAGIVTEATAVISSKDGTFIDHLPAFEYEDVLFEASRVRGRKRPRRSVTPERLDEVARIADEHPRTPTAAVQHRFGISRGYARKLIKLADEREFESGGERN